MSYLVWSDGRSVEDLLRVVDWLLHCDRTKVMGLVGLVGYE